MNSKSEKIQFGPISELILLGGGKLIRELSLSARNMGISVKIVTSPRHAAETEDSVSLQDFLKKHDYRFIVVESVLTDEVKDFIALSPSSVCLSIGAPWLFSEKTIASLFGNKLINLHGTRLPHYRGGGGFSWQILSGNRFGMCCLHLIDGGIDTGPIIKSEEFLYPASLRVPLQFEEVYIERNAEFLKGFIKEIKDAEKDFHLVRQPEYLSTYWPRLNSNVNSYIDWNLDGQDVDLFIRAFDDPYLGSKTFLNDTLVRLKKSSLGPQEGFSHPFKNGLVFRKGPGWLCIVVSNATLIVEEITTEDGKDLFNSIRVGDRLHTPYSFLDLSKERVNLGPSGWL